MRCGRVQRVGEAPGTCGHEDENQEEAGMGDWRQIWTWTRAEMLKRVARFSELRGSDGGLPDSDVPECWRTLYNVIGFQPPKDRTREATTSPVGDDASNLAAIGIAEGFNLGYCRAKPGKGPLMHNHD